MSSKQRCVALALSIAVLACACSSANAGPSGADKAAKPQAGKVTMQVTEAGFVPAKIAAKRGEPLELVITRKTDATCAKEILIDGTDIHVKLPLDAPVSVKFTPGKSGELKFGCAMDKMIGGVFLIE